MRFVIVSVLCPHFFAKAEISCLGTNRGDSECKAVLSLFMSEIGALGCMLACVCALACAGVRV